jgi:hypothetical protein
MTLEFMTADHVNGLPDTFDRLVPGYGLDGRQVALGAHHVGGVGTFIGSARAQTGR